MTFIVAATYRSYLGWCARQKPPVNPRGPEVRFVRDVFTLRGAARGFDYLCLHDWTDRRDWMEIFVVLRERGKRP